MNFVLSSCHCIYRMKPSEYAKYIFCNAEASKILCAMETKIDTIE